MAAQLFAQGGELSRAFDIKGSHVLMMSESQNEQYTGLMAELDCCRVRRDGIMLTNSLW